MAFRRGRKVTVLNDRDHEVWSIAGFSGLLSNAIGMNIPLVRVSRSEESSTTH